LPDGAARQAKKRETRKPTARAKAERVRQLGSIGFSPPKICRDSGMARSSAYRALQARSVMKSLTWRQREVCALIARGLTNRRIADDLGISTHMVKMHIEEIMNLTKLENRTQIAVWWVRLKGWRGVQCSNANYTCRD
jgi:DNA-binding NarL/FixJ family response regulator